MQNDEGIVRTKEFTISPVSREEIKSFLNSHLGSSLMEIMNIEHYKCDCKVKSAEGEKIVSISLPTNIFHHKLEKEE